MIYAMSRDMIEENNEMIAIMLRKVLAQVHQKHTIISKTCMLKKEIWPKMAIVATTKVFLVLGITFDIHWGVRLTWRQSRRKTKVLENTLHQLLDSKRKATKMFVKTPFRIESYLKSTSYIRSLACSTKHADFVLQDRIGKEIGLPNGHSCYKL